MAEARGRGRAHAAAKPDPRRIRCAETAFAYFVLSEVAMPLNPADLQKLQTGIAAGISDRDGLSNALAAKNADLARMDAEIARLTASGDLLGAQQQATVRAQLESARSIDLASLSAINDTLRDTIGRLGINIDPC